MRTYLAAIAVVVFAGVIGCSLVGAADDGHQGHAGHGSAHGAAADDPVPDITPAFAENKTAYDPKHTPKITAPDKVKVGEWFDVTVEVGQGQRHPSFAEHFVRYIAIYTGEVEIARTYLHPVYSSPKVTFTIRLKETSTIRAVEEANHTAGWISEKKIKVVN